MIAWLLKRPYTIAALLLLVCLLGVGSAMRMPTDIFPEINIPVVSVVWTYSGMTPTEIQNRILTMHERQMPSLVDNIERHGSQQLSGRGGHQGLSARRARTSAGRCRRWPAVRWWCSSTCRETSRRHWCCGMGRRTCRSFSWACRAIR